MKRLIISILSLALPFVMTGQNYNPFVAQGIISPSPLFDVASNGSGLISLVVGNSGSDALPLVTNQEMLLTITLSRGVPNHINPLSAIGGTMASFFNWAYDPVTKSYLGIQNQSIPDGMNGGTGTLTIGYKVTSNSVSTSLQNGFNANLTPPAYTNGINTMNDDQVSSYTWTEMKFIPNIDFAVTHVGLPFTGNVSTNDQVPVGTTYSNPPANPSNPATCTPLIAANGSYTFTCSTPGEYSFLVPSCDPSNAVCREVPLVITVLDPAITNNPPVANPDYTTTNVNTAITFPVLANDQCENGLSCLLQLPTVFTAPAAAGAVVTVNPNGSMTYTPAPGFVGKDSFQYSVCDNQAVSACDREWVYITVLATGYPLSTNACDDYLQLQVGTPRSGNVLGNDNDPDGEAQSVTPQVTTIAGKGTLNLSSNGDFSFNPDPAFVGALDFEYAVSDNHPSPSTAKATLHVFVSPINIALPALMDYFTAETAECDVLLKWRTLQEKNTSHFNVLRKGSQDASFKVIGKIAQAGNSTTPRDYSYLDKEPGYGKFEYKLEGVDIDGQTQNSETRIVNVDCSDGIAVFPNPAYDFINVRFNAISEKEYSIRLTDMDGKTVLESSTATEKGTKTIRMSVAHLASGIYNVLISDGNDTHTFKVTVDHK